MHRCQPGNVRCLEASPIELHASPPTWQRRVSRRISDRASCIAANLVTHRFLETSPIELHASPAETGQLVGQKQPAHAAHGHVVVPQIAATAWTQHSSSRFAHVQTGHSTSTRVPAGELRGPAERANVAARVKVWQPQ